MPLLSSILLWTGGLCFLGFGLAFMIAPLQTLAAAGVELQGAIAVVEIRAFYGGLEIALGLCLMGAALISDLRRPGLILNMASYGGIGLARGIGMLMAGVASPFLWFALVTELVLAGLSALALLHRRRRAA